MATIADTFPTTAPALGVKYLFPDAVLLIFCKAPFAGQVKTRLMAALSPEQAVSAHIALAKMTLGRAFEKPLCPVQLYCSPDTDHPFFEQCALNYPLDLKIQNGADLGQRMSNAFKEALAIYRHAVLTGSDCPSLSADDFSLAFSALKKGSDAVLGPAEDGGYVLVGLNAPQPSLFESMVWGVETVMTETRLRADQAGLTVYELPEQWDVDGIEDWRRFLREKTIFKGRDNEPVSRP